MRLRKKSVLSSFVLLTAILLFSSCKDKQAQQATPPDINVVEVIQKEIPIYKEYVGQTYGYKDIPIRARVDGYLTGIHFKEGFGVKKGQLLYTIDQQPYQAKVAEAMGQLAKAKTELVRAENELNRIKPLAEMKAVSESDLDAALAEQGAAKASVEAAEASLRLARINLGYTNLKSPINGLIGKTLAKEGEYVGKNPNPVILNTVSRIDNIRVEFFLTESEYLYFFRKNKDNSRKKASLELILADGSLHKHKGKIDFIDRNVDPTTGAILLQATFPNPEKLIRPGQYAKVKALIEINKNALIVPQKCIKELQGKYSAFIVNSENKVELKEVLIAGFYDDFYIISDGVKVGDKVIIEGIQKVAPEMVVKPNIIEFKSQAIKK
ncbi:MAG: efflux RND transporter periplasmic adaptor subunit [Bacteroidales bacterium]|nr:efflux RND transporter periplasmic adaptor subunit [Bacteroidales bacterium]